MTPASFSGSPTAASSVRRLLDGRTTWPTCQILEVSCHHHPGNQWENLFIGIPYNGYSIFFTPVHEGIPPVWENGPCFDHGPCIVVISSPDTIRYPDQKTANAQQTSAKFSISAARSASFSQTKISNSSGFVVCKSPVRLIETGLMWLDSRP